MNFKWSGKVNVHMFHKRRYDAEIVMIVRCCESNFGHIVQYYLVTVHSLNETSCFPPPTYLLAPSIKNF